MTSPAIRSGSGRGRCRLGGGAMVSPNAAPAVSIPEPARLYSHSDTSPAGYGRPGHQEPGWPQYRATI